MGTQRYMWHYNVCMRVFGIIDKREDPYTFTQVIPTYWQSESGDLYLTLHAPSRIPLQECVLKGTTLTCTHRDINTLWITRVSFVLDKRPILVSLNNPLKFYVPRDKFLASRFSISKLILFISTFLVLLGGIFLTDAVVLRLFLLGILSVYSYCYTRFIGFNALVHKVTIE